MLFNPINLWLCTFDANYLVHYLGMVSIVEKNCVLGKPVVLNIYDSQVSEGCLNIKTST